MNSNPTPRSLSGTTAERPLAADVPVGTFYFDITLPALYVVVTIGGLHVWELSTSSSSPFGIPQGEIVFGSPTGGLASSPFLGFDPVSSFLFQSDPAGSPMFMQGGMFRISQWSTPNGMLIFAVQTDAGNPGVVVSDDQSNSMLDIDSRVAFRTIRIDDAVNSAMIEAFTNATRAWSFDDDNEADMLTHFLAVLDRRSAWITESALPVLSVETRNIQKRILSAVPIGLGKFTLAAANALNAALGKVEGAVCYITDGHKPGEVAPTGVPAYYSAAGPAGAGWYNFGLATHVS